MPYYVDKPPTKAERLANAAALARALGYDVERAPNRIAGVQTFLLIDRRDGPGGVLVAGGEFGLTLGELEEEVRTRGAA